MSLSPERGQPGVRVSRGHRLLPSNSIGAVSQRALDDLIERALALLPLGPRDVARGGLEAAMDYLASREEFMCLLDASVESILGRPSAGSSDGAHTDAAVHLMNLVQQRLAAQQVAANH